MKTCSRCNETKPKGQFSACSKAKDGLQYWCRDCRRDYYSINRSKIRAQWKEYASTRKDERTASMRRWRANNYEKQWATNTTVAHGSRGYDVIITKEELVALALSTRTCGYCGCELKWGPGKFCTESPTLDRVDNEHELRPDNVQIICQGCNRTKQDRTHEQFIAYCRAIAARFGN